MPYANAVYSNIVPGAPLKRSAAERKAEAASQRDAEARLKRKVEQANAVLDRLEERASYQAAVIKAMTRRKAATLARIERIEDRILREMDAAGLTEVTGIRSKMRSQLAAAALEIVDESLIPRMYFNTPKAPPATPDKVAIKKALAADDDLDPRDWGCKLTSKVSLVRS
jgi:hypothetical protein